MGVRVIQTLKEQLDLNSTALLNSKESTLRINSDRQG